MSHQAHLDDHIAGSWEVGFVACVQDLLDGAGCMMACPRDALHFLTERIPYWVHPTLSCTLFRGGRLGSSPKKGLLIGPSQSSWSYYPCYGAGLVVVT